MFAVDYNGEFRELILVQVGRSLRKRELINVVGIRLFPIADRQREQEYSRRFHTPMRPPDHRTRLAFLGCIEFEALVETLPRELLLYRDQRRRFDRKTPTFSSRSSSISWWLPSRFYPFRNPSHVAVARRIVGPSDGSQGFNARIS